MAASVATQELAHRSRMASWRSLTCLDWSLVVALLGFTGFGAAAYCWFGSLSAMGAALRGQALHLSAIERSVKTVPAGVRLRFPFQLMNLSSRPISLAPRRVSCMPAYIEGLPELLGPWKRTQFTLVVDTFALRGKESLGAIITSDSPSNPTLDVAVSLVIEADELSRGDFLGLWRAGAVVKREVTISNVPGSNLIRIGPTSPPGWSVVQKTSDPNCVVLEIVGATPKLDDDRSEDPFGLRFDLYFQGADVRRTRVSLHALLVSEWEIPAVVSINPLSVSNGSVTFTVIHRPLDESRDQCNITCIGTTSENIRLKVSRGNKSNSRGWTEHSTDVVIDVHEPRRLSHESIRLRMDGDGGGKTVDLPVVVAGFGG